MIHRLKLYCDMDGVLVNFDKGYHAAAGKPPSGTDDDAFWKPVLDTPDFWLNLEWMPGGRELWDYVSQHHYVVLLSSPGTHDTERARRQKLQWVRRELGDHVNLVLKQAKEKHYYACNRSVLIDDWKRNIERWHEAGGLGVHHKDADQTINELQTLGLNYKRTA